MVILNETLEGEPQVTAMGLVRCSNIYRRTIKYNKKLQNTAFTLHITKQQNQLASEYWDI